MVSHVENAFDAMINSVDSGAISENRSVISAPLSVGDFNDGHVIANHASPALSSVLLFITAEYQRRSIALRFELCHQVFAFGF